MDRDEITVREKWGKVQLLNNAITRIVQKRERTQHEAFQLQRLQTQRRDLMATMPTVLAVDNTERM